MAGEENEAPVDERVEIAKALETQLCSNGQAFQIRAAAEANLAFENGSPWVFEALEYPVEVRGRDTRIDFVLRHSTRPIYMAAECKRVNPKLNLWCFLRSPYVRRDRVGEKWIVEGLEATPEGGIVTSPRSMGEFREGFFNLGFAIKNYNAKTAGDPAAQGGREAIEEASGQIMRGVAGLLDGWASRYSREGDPFSIGVIPAIFTTARLFECTTDLTTTELATGNVSVKPEDLQERPWVLYQYHRSPGVTSSVPLKPFGENGALGTFGRRDPMERLDVSLARNLDAAGIRTIAVVSAPQIGNFLKRYRLDGVMLEPVK